MRYNYISRFSPKIREFILFKTSLGYSEESYDHKLKSFDQFCFDNYPDADILTEEIARAWCQFRDGENPKTLASRATVLRMFAQYLNMLGEKAYILPTGLFKITQNYSPYIFTDEELIAFFAAADNYSPKESKYYYNSYIIPVLFRIMLCCGLRPQEIPNLKRDHIDCLYGTIYIEESKGRKDRLIPMPDDLTDMCKKYDKFMSEVMPDREYFFTPKRGGKIPITWMRSAFYHCWKLAGIQFSKEHAPRNYDWRHNYASRRVASWLNEGKDIKSLLPILQTYMGHENIEQTLYYVSLTPSQIASSGYTEWECNIPVPDFDD